MYGFGPNSRNPAYIRAMDVGVRGGTRFVTVVSRNQSTIWFHAITSGPPSSIVLPAKASGVMQYLRMAAATSPYHTGCFSAAPPLMLISHG